MLNLVSGRSLESEAIAELTDATAEGTGAAAARRAASTSSSVGEL
jgi:hypothetical protein